MSKYIPTLIWVDHLIMSLGVHPIHDILHDKFHKECEYLNIVVILPYVAKLAYLDVVSKGVVHVSNTIDLKKFHFTYALHLNIIIPNYQCRKMVRYKGWSAWQVLNSLNHIFSRFDQVVDIENEFFKIFGNEIKLLIKDALSIPPYHFYNFLGNHSSMMCLCIDTSIRGWRCLAHIHTYIHTYIHILLYIYN